MKNDLESRLYRALRAELGLNSPFQPPLPCAFYVSGPIVWKGSKTNG